MKKKISVALTLMALLSACGGGSDPAASSGTTGSTGSTASTDSSSSKASSSNPLTANYWGYNFRQNLTTGSWYLATFIDNGVGVQGSLTYGRTPNSYPAKPNADGSITYSAPVIASTAIGQNSVDTNLPEIAMLCQNGGGAGTTGTTSTDILVSNQANGIGSATELAGQTFKVYREDCSIQTGVLSFDASGNMTVNDNNHKNKVYSADAVTAALQGQPIFDSSMYTMLYAFSYIKSDGTKAYAVIEHDSNVTTNLTDGIIGLWSQQ